MAVGDFSSGRVNHDALTPWVKIWVFLDSSISSSFSLVVALPAEEIEKKKLFFFVKRRSLNLTPGMFFSSLTNFQLPLDSALAPFPVICLRFVVVRHHFYKLPGQRRVLRRIQHKNRRREEIKQKKKKRKRRREEIIQKKKKRRRRRRREEEEEEEENLTVGFVAECHWKGRIKKLTWVFLIRKSAEALFCCSSCSILCSMTVN